MLVGVFLLFLWALGEGDEVWVLHRGVLQTPSDPEGSSGKKVSSLMEGYLSGAFLL